ncbi:hypothetical protein S83_016435 [Arachis hypogaea]
MRKPKSLYCSARPGLKPEGYIVLLPHPPSSLTNRCLLSAAEDIDAGKRASTHCVGKTPKPRKLFCLLLKGIVIDSLFSIGTIYKIMWFGHNT